jgi:DNA-binding transcriptional ArsR family regulator
MVSPAPDFEQLLSYLKALADQSRLRILGLLAARERSVEELAALLALKAPTVSHHLALLKELDLVTMRADGTTHLYRLNNQQLEHMNRVLAAPERLAQLASSPAAHAEDGEEGDAWERKVLRDFSDGARFKEIPASLKKRIVILKWLARQFEERRLYTEREVNELLKRYHPDSATLRRELIGNRFLARENALYWRPPTPPDNV